MQGWSQIAFREKIAWLSLIATGAVLVFVFSPPPEDVGAHWTWSKFVVGAGIMIVVMIVGAALIALTSRSDANAPADEREQIIELKATAWSQGVFKIGCVGVAVGLFMGLNPVGMANHLILAFIVAEFIRFACQIALYRKGV